MFRNFTQIYDAMPWALIACVAFPGILVYSGLHVLRRGTVFADLALAQMAALGTCVALHFGKTSLTSYLASIGVALLGAGVVALIRPRNPLVPREAGIAILYLVASAMAILLLSRKAEGDEEMRRLLVGELLLIGSDSVRKQCLIYAVLAVVHFLVRKRIAETSAAWDFAFYAMLAIAVGSFVQVGGVLLCFGFLLIPAAAASLLAKSLWAQLAIGWIFASAASIIALGFSFKMDLSTGATIVCSMTFFALCAWGISLVRKK